MNSILQIAILCAIVVYFGLLVFFLKKRTLHLKYTLLWLLSGILMLLLTLFPSLLEGLASFLGVYAPTNALFAIIIFCLIIILVSITAIVSKLNDRVKRLTQSQALLEKRIRELETDG